MPIKFTAFTPLLNAGNDLSSFEFDGGLRIDMGLPDALVVPLQEVARSDYISRHEALHFQVARGWMWIQREENPVDDRLWDFVQTNYFVAKLKACLACAHLAGCGENDYWRYGAQIEVCGVYRTWQNDRELRVLPPVRFNFRYAYPAVSEYRPEWNAKNLAHTSQLFSVVRNFEGSNMPRLWMTFRIWNVLGTLHPAQVFIRFQLAVSALETFYIAPEEGEYIWTVPERTEVICRIEGVTPLATSFWGELRKLRNDITHRGGLPQVTKLTPQGHEILLNTERLLQTTIRWAFKNQSDAANALDHGRWPRE